MLITSSTHEPFRRRRLALPSILHWNTNGLRSRLSELSCELLRTPTDVLALQEANFLLSERRIHSYTAYHSMPAHSNRRPKASLYVHVDVGRAERDLSGFRSAVTEYGGVRVAVSVCLYYKRICLAKFTIGTNSYIENSSCLWRLPDHLR